MTQGRFIAVVGPSGVGKDSVMEALAAAEPNLTLVRRVITRPSAAGGEVFEGVTEAEFAKRKAAGDFALSWPAHGLHYGIPREVDDALATGRDMLANLSRGVLAEGVTRFARFETILLTADTRVLAQRLAQRGRESAAEITRRLERAEFAMPARIKALEVDNSGPLEETVPRILSALYPISETR